MDEAVVFRYEDITRSVRATQEALLNPKPRLRIVARFVTKTIRDLIKNEGAGTWRPYAASTLKRMQQTGTSDITQGGTARVSKLRKVGAQIEKIRKTVVVKGWNPKLRQKFDRLLKKAQSLRKQEGAHAGREERKTAAKATIERLRGNAKNAKELRQYERANETLKKLSRDRLGKRVAQTHKLLARMPGTIRAKLMGEVLRIYSKAGAVADAQNDMREFIPPPNMDEVMDFFKEVMEAETLAAWEKAK